MPTTFPDINCDTKSKRSRSNRILKADFGDGYAQTGKDGLNTAIEEWDLSFDNYDKVDILTITTFLDARENVESFYWTPPDEVTPKLWRQEGDYNVSFNGPLTRSLSVKLKRVYSL